MKENIKHSILLLFLTTIATIFCFIIFLLWPIIRAASSVTSLEDGLYSMEYKGDYGFDEFLSHGGAESDLAAADFVIRQFFHGWIDLNLESGSFGCSTIAASASDGSRLFGRNFDWGSCAALIVQTRPESGYASISTVNMDFLNLGLNLPEPLFVRLMSAAAPYAPMDGMNEKGLCVTI